MGSPTCSVCKNVSESQRYVSICPTCSKHGFSLEEHKDNFMPYYEMTSRESPEIRYRVDPLAKQCDMRYGTLVRTYVRNHPPKESTMVKKELVLGKTHKVDVGVLITEKKDMREYIIGDYLKVPVSKTKIDHVKRAFALKEYAKQILPSDPVQALCYLQKQKELGKRGKKVDVEKLKVNFFDNVDLFANVCSSVGSIIAAYAGVTFDEKCKLGGDDSRCSIGDKIPLLKHHEEMLVETPLVLLKSSLSDNGIAMAKVDDFLKSEYFEQFIHEFTFFGDMDVKCKHETIAKEMVHFSKTVRDVAARKAYFDSHYGSRYHGSKGAEYISGEQFVGKTVLRHNHVEGSSILASMWDC